MIKIIFALTTALSAGAQTPAVPPPPPPLQQGAAAAPTQTPPGDAAVPANDPNLRNSADPLSGLLDPFEYQDRGRRDPFKRPDVDKPVAEGTEHGPFLPLQRFDLKELELTGIIWDVAKPRAMILDPEKKVHIVGPNTKIGKNNGYIAVIREGEIVVVETMEEEGRLLSSTKIVRLLSK